MYNNYASRPKEINHKVLRGFRYQRYKRRPRCKMILARVRMMVYSYENIVRKKLFVWR